jgi:hypothetical protein
LGNQKEIKKREPNKVSPRDTNNLELLRLIMKKEIVVFLAFIALATAALFIISKSLTRIEAYIRAVHKPPYRDPVRGLND